tara:strand:- start:1981 stop:2388 length:408 start_codon:yes stop_codon:yes gene_type:complete
MENKYSNSKIYGIKCEQTGDLYIGSTYEDLNTRLQKHLTDYKGWKSVMGFEDNGNKERAYRSSFKVFFNENYKVYKIKDYPCENQWELEAEEYRTMDLLESQGEKIVNVKRKSKKLSNNNKCQENALKLVPNLKL